MRSFIFSTKAASVLFFLIGLSVVTITTLALIAGPEINPGITLVNRLPSLLFGFLNILAGCFLLKDRGWARFFGISLSIFSLGLNVFTFFTEAGNFNVALLIASLAILYVLYFKKATSEAEAT